MQHEVYSGVVAFYGVDEKGPRSERKRKNPLEVFPGEHPALVSPADFARAQELRQMFAHRVRLGHTQPHMYPLSGLLLCDTCGRNMRGMTSGGRRYYRDVTHVNHIGNCVQKTVRADVAEQQVVDLLCGVKLPSDWQEWVMSNHFTPQERATLAESEQALQARLDRATELYLAGAITREKYQAEKWHAKGVRRTGPVCVQRRWMLQHAPLFRALWRPDTCLRDSPNGGRQRKRPWQRMSSCD